MSFDESDLRRRMNGALNSLKEEFIGLRTGRASTALLDTLKVDAYGSKMPINQVASLSTPEARLILIQVWDQSMVNSIEKSIRESDLGLNPQTEGSSIRIPIPELSQDRRIELVKVAGKYSEQAKISIRNVRRDIIESIRKLEKEGKTYMSMFQAQEGHCVKCRGELATLEYFDIQEEFLEKYLEN